MKEIIDRARRFAASRIQSRDDLNRKGHFPRDLWHEMGEAGLLGLLLPTGLGGAGLGRRDQVEVAEALVQHGRNLGIVSAWQSQTTLSSYLIDRLGSDEQRRSLLPGLAEGRTILSVAISELGAGAHPKHLKTQATARDGGWSLSGEKAYVTNGPVADLFVVIAITALEGARKRYSAFLVPRETPGLSFTEAGAVDYLRPALHCGLKLDDCRVPEEAILGPKHEAYPILAQPLRTAEDLVGLGTGLGGMRAALNFLGEEREGQPDDAVLEEVGLLSAVAAGTRQIVFSAIEAYEGEGGERAAIPLVMAARERIAGFQARMSALKEKEVPRPSAAFETLARDMGRLGSAAGYVQRIRLRGLGREALSAS